jgi:hypothetical protein
MARVARAALGLVLVVAGGLALLVSIAFTMKPERVEAIARGVADITLPEGYSLQWGASALGYSAVSIDTGAPRGHIFLVKMPHYMRNDIDRALDGVSLVTGVRGYDKWSRTRVTGEAAAVVGGVLGPVVVSEGQNSDGGTYIEWTTVFERDGHPTAVVISSPAEQWDEETARSFLAEVR